MIKGEEGGRSSSSSSEEDSPEAESGSMPMLGVWREGRRASERAQRIEDVCRLDSSLPSLSFDLSTTSQHFYKQKTFLSTPLSRLPSAPFSLQTSTPASLLRIPGQTSLEPPARPPSLSLLPPFSHQMSDDYAFRKINIEFVLLLLVFLQVSNPELFLRFVSFRVAAPTTRTPSRTRSCSTRILGRQLRLWRTQRGCSRRLGNCLEGE